MKTLLLATAALGLAFPALAQVAGGAEEESSIAMDDAPEAAMAAAQENAMGVEFDNVQIDTDGGAETYEFSGTKDDGMMLEVDVLADGTVEEIEEEVAIDAVPEAVRATLDAEVPGMEPSFVEKSTREDGAQIVYEFEGTHDGQEVDVEVNEDGSNFVRNEDAAG